MRRLLILILAVVVPLKAWASLALPLADAHQAGSPAACHAGHAGHAHAEISPVLAGGECVDEQGAPPHAGECHHLSMALLPTAPLHEAAAGVSAPPATASPPLVSVVLDVLHPPPLARP